MNTWGGKNYITITLQIISNSKHLFVSSFVVNEMPILQFVSPLSGVLGHLLFAHVCGINVCI